MKWLRLLGLDPVSCYHVVSGVVGRRLVMGEREKRVFRDIGEAARRGERDAEVVRRVGALRLQRRFAARLAIRREKKPSPIAARAQG